MKTPADQLTDYLTLRGIEPLWVSGAMGVLCLALNTNTYFTTKVSKMRLLSGDHGTIRSFAFDADLDMPDSKKKAKARIAYTFCPRGKKAHRVKLTLKG